MRPPRFTVVNIHRSWVRPSPRYDLLLRKFSMSSKFTKPFSRAGRNATAVASTSTTGAIHGRMRRLRTDADTLPFDAGGRGLRGFLLISLDVRSPGIGRAGLDIPAREGREGTLPDRTRPDWPRRPPNRADAPSWRRNEACPFHPSWPSGGPRRRRRADCAAPRDTPGPSREDRRPNLVPRSPFPGPS